MRTFLFLLGTVSALTLCVSAGGKESTEESYTPPFRWLNGPTTDPDTFPIGVWLQSPSNAKRYKEAGINLYIGLWQGPTEGQLKELKAARMRVICEQNEVGLAHRNDPFIAGWMHGDEPDNAQPIKDPVTGKESYGPPVPPKKIVADYWKIRRKDPSRPVLLNLGQGVANDAWVGRGSDARPEDYLTYVKGSDIVSFDVYPVAGLDKGEDLLWYVAKGVKRLKGWIEGRQTVWNCLECTRIGNLKAKPTPHQVRAEAWMSIIHGSTGLIWFVHQFEPTFNEHALLDDPLMLPAVTALNRQIQQLAPVIHRPALKDAVQVASSSEGVPIASVAKRYGEATYLLTVGMRNGATKGTFRLQGGPKTGSVEVLGESRKLPIHAGRFVDNYRPYDVHLYRIRG